MVDADSHLKLLPTSILDTYKVIEHIDMLSMDIQYYFLFRQVAANTKNKSFCTRAYVTPT
jgi:hypothetical protein